MVEEKFTLVLEQIKKDGKKVGVFAILKMDDIADKWSVIVSAPWIADGGQGTIEDYKYIKAIITSKLDSSLTNSIARIGMLPKDDHLIMSLLTFQSGTPIKEKTQVNGNVVYEGLVLESNPRAWD